ncbi:MAG TPA: hypothetical protein VJ867_13175, partial [Gemmatimonadaceae bacterium]|nr:hypothetical protein [Gemmatimonadaceae bacterium]
VSMIDFSCADEIIAKLLLRHPAEREGYFVLRGVTEGHWDAIETVLERHGLAVLIERESGVELAGVVDDAERRAFDALKRRGRAECWQLAHDVGEAEPRMRGVVENMWRRRLVMRAGDSFMPVGQLA